jgi:hypothetical protein
MKIVYIQTPVYDYLTATLIEGLQQAGHTLLCSEASNYGNRVADAELIREAETADLILCGSNMGVRTQLLHSVRNPRICFVDGNDHQAFAVPDDIRFKAIFKRELSSCLPEPEKRGIYPLPFAAEQRYFSAPRPKDLLVSFLANMFTNPLRASVHQRLINLRHPAVVSGSTNERAYNPANPPANALETPRYRELLARSLISVSVAGAGYDCARYWEILAVRAMLFTQQPDIVIPDPLIDGVSCVTFASLAEFDDKLRYYMGRPEECAAIAARGHEQLQRSHTTKARAEYALAIARRAVARDDYCADFLAPHLKQ